MEAQLLLLEIHANQAAADSKLRTVPQHGRAHSLFVEESSIGRIEILEIDVRVAHFQQAVMPRNLRIFQGDVCPFAAQYNARFCQRVTFSF